MMDKGRIETELHICQCVLVSDLIVSMGNSQVKPNSGYDDFLMV